MASVTKATVGAVTTYTIVDAALVSGTIAVTSGATTGMTTTIAMTGMHNDGLALAVSLLQQISTALLPGAGAQGLNP